jgi:hypothetical protein
MRVRSIRFGRFTDATCANSFEIAVDATDAPKNAAPKLR